MNHLPYLTLALALLVAGCGQTPESPGTGTDAGVEGEADSGGTVDDDAGAADTSGTVNTEDAVAGLDAVAVDDDGGDVGDIEASDTEVDAVVDADAGDDGDAVGMDAAVDGDTVVMDAGDGLAEVMGSDSGDAGEDDASDTTADAGADADADAETDPLAACREQLVGPQPWPNALREVALTGSIEFAQTHVVRPDDERLAPAPVQGRETLLLFTPDAPLNDDIPLLVAALDDAGVAQGVLLMQPPSALPAPLEADASATPLAPYSEQAWSARLPAAWMRDGVTLAVAYVDDTDTRYVFTHELSGLQAPHAFTVNRTHIVLFGEPEFPATTRPARELARDFFAALPFAELRVVESMPWRLDELVVRTTEGPRLVSSEEERAAVASDPDHWTILKNQMALRLNLANTGRGLALTGHNDGDSSPYSYGTWVAMGWFRDAAGQYRDIDDAPYAAGWTGWTAMWASECGNGFIHEVGHSMTLQHFTEGTAAGWGIADEYPNDGVNTAAHPWGYDTVRHRFRTWYRVDRNGPVREGGVLVGKRDPMNGGESPFAGSCYPQYTGYHAQRVQNWATSSPTLMELDGEATVARWNPGLRRYMAEEPAVGNQAPIAVGVPVATFIGTLANNDDATQIYPPIFTGFGNVFALPDPFGSDLPDTMDGARYFVTVEYEDGSEEHGLVNRGLVSDTSLSLFSFNVDLRRRPVEVRLSESASGYPAMTLEASTIVYARAIDLPDAPLPALVRVGGGDLGNRDVRLTERCEPGINCEQRRVDTLWRRALNLLNFGGELLAAAPSTCDAGGITEFRVPVVDEDGATDELIVHGQRLVRSGAVEVVSPLTDATPWVASDGLEQGVRLWLPWAPNADLPAGRYRQVGAPELVRNEGGIAVGELPVLIDLEVLESVEISLDAPWLSEALTTPDSSMYFLAREESVGPVTRVWWDDGVAGTTQLRVPVVDAATGTPTFMLVNAAHDENGSRYDLNAGRGAGNNPHRVRLELAAAGNEHLVAGREYRTPASAPLVLEGRRWHAPNAESLVGVFAFDVSVRR